jgi:hypothetical protein
MAFLPHPETEGCEGLVTQLQSTPLSHMVMLGSNKVRKSYFQISGKIHWISSDVLWHNAFGERVNPNGKYHAVASTPRKWNLFQSYPDVPKSGRSIPL